MTIKPKNCAPTMQCAAVIKLQRLFFHFRKSSESNPGRNVNASFVLCSPWNFIVQQFLRSILYYS